MKKKDFGISSPRMREGEGQTDKSMNSQSLYFKSRKGRHQPPIYLDWGRFPEEETG
jgi:hypothetical protein